MEFNVIKKEGGARVGEIKIDDFVVKTPAFVPVATKAAIKSLTAFDIEELMIQMLIANTYHLSLRPGAEIIREFGGIQKFSGIRKPFMSDSGGFQAFSLGKGAILGRSKFEYEIEKKPSKEASIAKISEEGVYFRSIYDKSLHLLSPEKSIEIQHDIGANIILALDECNPPSADYDETKEAAERTERWAKRCLAFHKEKKSSQAIYGIIQGGLFRELRERSAKAITSMDFDGFGIGGSFGRNKMYETLGWLQPFLDKEKPVHLLGIGAIEDIIESVSYGIDSFDCVSPTMIGRAGYILITPESGGNRKNKFRIKITNNRFAGDKSAIDENCDCKMCKRYSKSYLNHLFKAKEFSAYAIASYHNLYFMEKLMNDIRDAIENNRFKRFKEKWLG
ncbi:MAG: queuine tRNA-ribosyltransferase [Candidatus Woesearchaeota archaeon]|nr:queuine tRNA-ribosyltransferase [Candidatus Woesearchaeota archaeon]MDK2907562.1 queuine tRNA-ribosyltransferase [Candidatus Woesearchaeota archaeon]